MTVITKHPWATKKRNEDFFKRKNKELTNLDWAKWAGWFDTDGCFTTYYNKKQKRYQRTAEIRLKDRQPVELFSDTFETSLRYREFNTVTPEGGKYIAKMFGCCLCGPRAEWFTENVSPYLIKEEKREFAGLLLEDTVSSKSFNTWTKDELTHYLATVIEGDGGIQIMSKPTSISKSLKIAISSSDPQYLANLISISASQLNIKATYKKVATYKNLKGVRYRYRLYILCSMRNPHNMDFIRSLLKPGVMTLDRKKEVVQEFIDFVDSKKNKKSDMENRV